MFLKFKFVNTHVAGMANALDEKRGEELITGVIKKDNKSIYVRE